MHSCSPVRLHSRAGALSSDRVDGWCPQRLCSTHAFEHRIEASRVVQTFTLPLTAVSGSRYRGLSGGCAVLPVDPPSRTRRGLIYGEDQAPEGTP